MRHLELSDISDADLRRMSRTELTNFLERIMYRLRMLDSEELRREIVTKSQSLRLASAKEN
jgi:hypothetical protein